VDGQPGLTLWTDGSRDENGAVGYAVAWRNGQSWVRRKAHMGYYQEAYDAECAVIARALDVAADRAKWHKLGRVRIFTDAQAALKRMTYDEPGPGQTYALQARQAIAALRKRKPAASEPDDHGVEWLKHADKYGRRALPPTSLAHLRRRASEKKWPEARSWCERRHLNKAYVLRKKGKLTRPQPGGEEDALAVLPAQVGACPHGCVPEEHRQPTGRPLLVGE